MRGVWKHKWCMLGGGIIRSIISLDPGTNPSIITGTAEIGRAALRFPHWHRI